MNPDDINDLVPATALLAALRRAKSRCRSWSEQLEVEEAMAAVSELMEALRDLLVAAERLDPTEGVCCCGDDMARHAHPMSCGHEPVDAGHYYHGAVIERARAAIAKAEGMHA